MKKILILSLVAVAVFFFFFFGGPKYLSLDYLQSQIQTLRDLAEKESLVFSLSFFAVYVVSTALSFPGAAVLTLAAGAIFGVVWGTVLVSFASTLGATFAMLGARYVLRDGLQKKYQNFFEKINAGINKEGASYLFTLRLIPIFPFFVINAIMGLTSMPVLKYFWVSQLGMIPGTIIYVNAGTQLSQITSMRGLVSGPVLLSLALLGIFPYIAKFFIAQFKKSRAFAKYKRPKKYDYNMVVIGAGAGGLVSAYIAAATKAKVALIEKHKMGGDCLNTGCVPSKALIRTAHLMHDMKNSKAYGVNKASCEFSFAEVMERVHKVIAKIEPHDSVERYSKLGVECIQGEAKIKSPFEVEVNGKILTTKAIIVATGARPLMPNIPGLKECGALNSDIMWNIKELPKRLVVLGGGPIGSEMAQAFARIGSEVTLVEKGDRILPREDKSVSELMHKTFEKEGIKVQTSCEAKEVTQSGGGKILKCLKNGATVEIPFDQIIVALGRVANVKGFGLEELGIEISPRGTIEHDQFLRTNIPNIFAVGDVAGPWQFTHTAAHQAWYAAVNALFDPFRNYAVDERVIPWCTYTDPEVARVGLSEAEAIAKKIDFEKTIYHMDDLDRAITESADYGFVQVLTPRGSDQIIGATIVGARAGDLIAEFVLAMRWKLGMQKILSTIHTYPTFAEATKYTAGEWRRAHVPTKALQFVEKFHVWRRGA